MCSQINKQLEILKYIVYPLIKTSLELLKISKITGKSVKFIEKYEKLIYRKKII